MRSGSTAVAFSVRFAGATAGSVATASVKVGGRFVTTEVEVVAAPVRLSVSVTVTVPESVPMLAAVFVAVAPIAAVPSENDHAYVRVWLSGSEPTAVKVTSAPVFTDAGAAVAVTDGRDADLM